MSKWPLVLIILWLTIIPFVAHSGDESHELLGTHWNINKAVEHALNNRIELKIEQFQKQKLIKNKNERVAEYYPQLDFEFDLQYRPDTDPFTPIEIQAVVNGQPVFLNDVPVAILVENDPPEYNARSTIELAWNIYSGGYDSARVREIEKKIEGHDFVETIVKREIIKETIVAFVELLKTQLRRDNVRSELQYWKDSLNISKKKLESGELSKIEYRRTKLNFEEARIRKLKTDQEIRKKSVQFMNTIGVNDPGTLNDVTYLKYEEFPTIEALLKFELDLSALKYDESSTKISSAKEVIKQQRSEYLPNVDLYASYGYIGRNEDNLLDAIDDSRHRDTRYGVRLSWNIFNGYKTNARLDWAREERDRLTLEWIEKKWEYEVARQENQITLNLANSNVQIAEEKLSLLRAEERLAHTKWKNLSEITEIEYKKVKLKLKEGESELKMLKLDYYLAVIELASVGGVPPASCFLGC